MDGGREYVRLSHISSRIGGPPDWSLESYPASCHRKNKAGSFEMSHTALDWASSCELGSKASGFIKRRATC
jgi:hypothetical protein